MTDTQDSFWEKIAGKLHGELSRDEEAEFSQSITDSSKLNDFEKAQQIHEKLIKGGVIHQNDKVESWIRVEKGLRIYHLRWVRVALKYAAIIIIAFISGNLLKPSGINSKEPHFSEIVVPLGQMSHLTLSDGTKIWLNSGTTLRYPEQFSKNKREISVDGEAYFEVAKMPDKPFIINTSDMKVEVLGTSFDLSAYREDAISTVTLVEGKVKLQNPEGKAVAFLDPGNMAIKGKNQDEIIIKKVDTGFYSAWVKGKIYFDDEPLNQIAIKLERWFNVEITFADESLKTYKFTGTILKNKPVDQIMQALELLAPISFKHQININKKDRITIFKK